MDTYTDPVHPTVTMETSSNPSAPDTASEETNTWHIVQQPGGHCDIVSGTDNVTSQPSKSDDAPKTWGPFTHRTEAIAKRVGLIRAGHCRPQ